MIVSESEDIDPPETIPDKTTCPRFHIILIEFMGKILCLQDVLTWRFSFSISEYLHGPDVEEVEEQLAAFDVKNVQHTPV